MSGGLMSCGLKSGGLMSGGLKSYDRCAPYVNDNIDHVTSSRSVILATYYYVLANNVNAWTFV